MKSSDSITDRQLQTLLIALGFVGTVRGDGSMIYHHSGSDSLILLPANHGNRVARAADILSVGRHLVGQGHMEEEEFAAFVQDGALPERTQA